MPRSHVRKNDTVMLIAGPDKGKTGRVLGVLKEEGRALVEGIRMVKRHVRANARLNVKGGIVQKEGPVSVSNLMVVCPECSRATRIGVRAIEDGRRVRFCKKCKGQVEK